MKNTDTVRSRISSEHHRFKDHQTEKRLFKKRLFICVVLLITMLSVLCYRFYDLQIRHYQDYATQSDRNRLQVRPVAPNRGLIFDADGRTIAENRAVRSLTLTVERIKRLETTISELSEFIDITPRERENFYKTLGWRRRPFEAIPLKLNLTDEELARFAVNEHRFDGVEVQARLVRHYPYGDLFTHVGGYVGRINERELNGFNEKQTSNYAGTRSIGKIGLEKYYEADLHGTVGQEKIETDARGRVIRVVDRIEPIAGDNLHLFLDSDIQYSAVQAMAGRRGAVVALDIKSGGVLAFLSAPSYDPNLFVTGISSKDYRALNESRHLPLFNRAIQGQYPPGSTIKPMLGFGGLEAGVVTKEYSVPDPGFYQLENDNRLYRDWKQQGHGARVNLWTAIVESCDVYFYDLGFRMGVDSMHYYGNYFGMGQKTNIDIPSERAGLWPSREWKRRVRGLHWFPGNSLNMSIGQGDVLATPLQLAVMTATIARRGELIEPKVVQAIGVDTIEDTVMNVRSTYEGKQENWQLVIDTMRDVVHNPRGTAKSVGKNITFKMAGKTGTAQVVSIAQDGEYDSEALSERNRDHALFVGYGPLEDPQIAVAVLIENGEKSVLAGEVARDVIAAYVDKQNRQSAAAQASSSGWANGR